MSDALNVTRLEAAYGKIQVLWEVDVRAAKGDFISIVGANGAGKTTLLRVVSGLLPIRGGDVTVFGESIRGKSAAQIVRSGVGHVPEGRQLFPLMTVRENLDSGADYIPEARRVADATRKRVLELFPRLGERSAQLAGTLSGGERQMLAIGRALMSKPRLLLVDEPSLGLSPALTKVVFGALREVNGEGVTVVLVEQNVKQSLRLATNAYVLENGEVKKEGPGVSLLADPDVQAAYLTM